MTDLCGEPVKHRGVFGRSSKGRDDISIDQRWMNGRIKIRGMEEEERKVMLVLVLRRVRFSLRERWVGIELDIQVKIGSKIPMN